MVPTVEHQTQRAREVQAVREKAGGARLLHPDLVILLEILMIQATGTVNVASFLMSGQPLSAGCVPASDIILFVKVY